MPTNTDQQIGTVEILRLRVYPLDPATADHPLSTSVVVDPGVYPLYRCMDARYWMMTGRLNGRGPVKMGDGLFSIQSSDEANSAEVRFPSPTFGPEQWADLLDDPTFAEGHAEQRMRVHEH